MPTYVYRYPRRRYGRRYSRYRRPYSRYRRRRYGTSSTATNRGRIRVRVPIQQVVTMTIPANSTDSNVLTSTPYSSRAAGAPHFVCGAVSAPLYRAYANLYDQVKCDGVVTNLSIISPIGGGASATAAALQVIVAYDRCGTYDEANDPNNSLTVSSLFSYSSAVARSAINNSVAKMSRSCWASDLQERTTFHDSSLSVAANTVSDSDYLSNDKKIGYFAPLTLVGLRLPAAAPTADLAIQVLLEQTYYFTFRQPKFGGDPSATANTRMTSIPITMDTDLAAPAAAAAAMDDDGGLDDEDAAAAAPAARIRRSELREDLRQFFPNLPQ